MNWSMPVGRRTLLKVVGAGAATYLLGGCAAPTPAPGVPPAPSPEAGRGARGRMERVIRLAPGSSQGLFEPPHPFGVRTGTGAQHMSFLFDSLLWRDSTTEPIPWLAEEWKPSADGTEWTFSLRRDVKFQDGQPLTAEDVEFSYNYIASHPTSYYGRIADVLERTEALDERLVKITLKQPFAPFLRGTAASTPIIPKHIWADVTDPQKFNNDKAYIGTGPYGLAKLNDADGSSLFVANSTFFLGHPYVDRLEFVPVGDDLVALKAGALDIATPNVSEGFSNETLAPFRSDARFAIVEAPGEGVTALYFNHARGAPYTDKRFRQAVAHALDLKELIDRLLGGNGEAGSPGFLPSSNPLGTTDVKRYPHDLERARALLDEAGYVERNGRRTHPDGSPLAMSLLFGSNLVRVAELVRSHLSKVNINVELRPVDPGTASQLQGEGNYEAAIVTHGGLGNDPDTHMRRVFASPETAKHWQKCWGYSNSEYNDLARKQMRTMDEGARRELIHRMQHIVAEEMPIVHLYYPTRYLLYDPAVFDAWYYTPVWAPLHTNKHSFVTGRKTGLTIRQD
jgi:peptide/nickel transport system substrate-binding protein